LVRQNTPKSSITRPASFDVQVWLACQRSGFLLQRRAAGDVLRLVRSPSSCRSRRRRSRSSSASHAGRYFLTGERFGAETAPRIGLGHKLASDLDAAVERAVGVADVRAGARADPRDDEARPRRAPAWRNERS
jgi:hypothetical protein